MANDYNIVNDYKIANDYSTHLKTMILIGSISQPSRY